MTLEANLRTKLNAAEALRLLTQAGAKVRTKLNAMTPAARAEFFMAIEEARAALDVPMARLCAEAYVSAPHYERLVRVGGKGVTSRLITTLHRGLKTLQANVARELPRDMPPAMLTAAYRGCLAAVIEAFAVEATADAVLKMLARKGEFPADAAWSRASRTRRLAIYLASTELGLRGHQIALITGLSPAAVSIALGKVEDAMDDAGFEASMQKAAEAVRGRA